jgi:hypothetical protein
MGARGLETARCVRTPPEENDAGAISIALRAIGLHGNDSSPVKSASVPASTASV